MILLPLSLKHVAKIADPKGAGTRFATDGVQVERRPDGGAVVTATDTKVLVRVKVAPTDAADHPAPLAESTAQSGVVPAKFWGDTFAAAEKITRKAIKPNVKCVGISLTPTVAECVATDYDTTSKPQTQLIAGRFPPADKIIEDTEKRPTAATISVDPNRLAKILTVLAQFAPDDAQRVDIVIPEGPGLILLKVPTEGAVEQVTGLLMPFAG